MNQTKEAAEMLVACGYASEMEEVAYGLTKLKTFNVHVDGDVQSVDPYGVQPYSAAQKRALDDYNTAVKSNE